MAIEIDSRQAFVRWLKRKYPDVYMKAADYAQRGPTPINSFGFGQTDSGGSQEEQAWWEKIIDGAGKVAQTYWQTKAQRDLIDLNIERAKKGLEPVESTAVAPTVRVQHEAGGFDMQKALPFLAIGIGAIFLMRKR